MKKIAANAGPRKMPGRGTVRSMASLVQKGPIKSKIDIENMGLTARKDIFNDIKNEQEHIQKAASSSSYLSECMKNIFALPGEHLAENRKQHKSSEKEQPKTVTEVELLSNDLEKIAKEKKTFMTGLERKDHVITLYIPDEKIEEEPILDIPKPANNNIDDILGELENTEKQLKEENDDLAELRRRVDLTEKNMYLHMHSVGNIRHCLDNYHVSGMTKKPDKIIKGLKRSDKKTASALNIDKIKQEVDKELGIQKEDKIKLKGIKKNAGIGKTPATKSGIMNSLINITGRMTEFSNIIGKNIMGGTMKLPSLKKYNY